MAVSLYDTMRPVAIAAGLGAGCAGERGISLLVSGLAGLAVGLVTFIAFGRAVNLLLARIDRQPAVTNGETMFAVTYVAVFLVLLAVTISGCLAGRWLLHEAGF